MPPSIDYVISLPEGVERKDFEDENPSFKCIFSSFDKDHMSVREFFRNSLKKYDGTFNA